MSAVPPEAITAAALVLADVEGDGQTYRALADDVLRAAAPLIAAAERERIRALAARLGGGHAGAPMLGAMTMAHGFEVAAPGTPVDGEGWHMPPAGLQVVFAVGRPPETGGFAVRCGGVLLATGQAEAMLAAPPPAPGVVIMAARHLDPGEGRIRPGHRLDGDDVAALRTVLWFAAGVGQDGAARRGPVRDGPMVANALAGPPVTAGPCLCGRQLYTVVTQALSHLDGTAPCSAPLPPLLDAETVGALGEDGADLAYRARGTRPRTGGRAAGGTPGGPGWYAAGSSIGGGGVAGGAAASGAGGGGNSAAPGPGPAGAGNSGGCGSGQPLPDWERDLLAEQAAAEAAGDG